jgi:photosystem II stability/assembly factor-like uncharacterized protein
MKLKFLGITIICICFLLVFVGEAVAGINSWTEYNTGMIGGIYFGAYGIAMSQSNNQIMYASSNPGGGGFYLYRSTDGANTWSQITSVPGSTQYACIQIHPTNSNIVYVGTNNKSWGILKTIDGGTTWSIMTIGLPPLPSSSYFHPIVIDQQNPNILYCGGSTVCKSTNAGANWVISGTGITQYVTAIAIDPTDSNILYAGTNDYLYKSINAGGSWSLLTTVSSAEFISIAVDSTNPQNVYSGGSNDYLKFFYKSTNAGNSWVISTSGLSARPMGAVLLDPSNPNIIYLCTSSGIFRSIDYGATWSRFGNLGVATYQLVMTASSSPTIFATGYYGVWGYTITSTGMGSASWKQYNDLKPALTKSDQRLSALYYLFP